MLHIFIACAAIYLFHRRLGRRLHPSVCGACLTHGAYTTVILLGVHAPGMWTNSKNSQNLPDRLGVIAVCFVNPHFGTL